MSLALELRTLMERYVSGELDRRTFDRSLATYMRTIGRAREDIEARRLYGEARTLLAELGDGYRTEDSVRETIRQICAEAPAAASTRAP